MTHNLDSSDIPTTPRVRRDLGGALRDDRGWVLALTALLIIPLMAFTSFAVDLGAWYSQARKLQRAADAASLAAAPLLPDTGKAKQAAVQSLIKNGICTPASTVTVPASCTPATNLAVVTAPQPGSTTKYTVDVQDTKATQYFSRLFTPTGVDITRRGTAERIKPVPMGSPRNFLGTRNIYATEPENFNLAVSGYCTKQEFGDRIAVNADNTGTGGPHSCVPGSPSYVKQNPEYSPDGYFYAVEFAAPVAGTYSVQYRIRCNAFGGTQRITFRDKNSNDPLAATVLSDVDITNATACQNGNADAGWVTLSTVISPTPGSVYFIQVRPLVPAGTPPGAGLGDQSHMYFSLRVAQPGGFSRCTADVSTASAANPQSNACPKLFALQHLGIWADLPGGNPEFFLASVGTEHAGKVMTVELFDSAEGADYIELLDPNGNKQMVEAEVGCKDATYQSENGSCTTGEAGPTGGYGPFTLDSIPVFGTGTQAWPNLTQNGKYSNRHLRLKFTLPPTYGTLYGTKTWWKIRYRVSGSIGDRTTWTVRIKGDPVRLVPNS